MKKIKFNIFDYIILGIIAFFIMVFVVGYAMPKKENTKLVSLSVEAPYDQAVYDQAKKEKVVYYGSINKPIQVTSVSKTQRADGDFLSITLESQGKIEENIFVFEGLRVLVGQKAEIHGGYFVQGKVTEVKYVD